MGKRIQAARIVVPTPPGGRLILANDGWKKRFETERLTAGWRKNARKEWKLEHGRDWLRAPVSVTAWPCCPRKHGHDVGNAYPTVKACLDGLVDAGAIGEDDPSWVVELILLEYSDDPDIGMFLTLETL